MNRPTHKIFSMILVVVLVLSFAATTTVFAAELPANEAAEQDTAATQTPEDEPAEDKGNQEEQPNTPSPQPPAEDEEPQAEMEAEETAEPEEVLLATVEEILAIAREDGAQAATLLNAYTDNEAFEAILKQILDLYYTENLTAQLKAFSAAIDERAATILQNYAAAAAERLAQGLDYLPGEILVSFRSDVAEPQAIIAMENLDSTVGEIVETPATEVVAVVDIPLDQTVTQAVQEVSSDPSVTHAQPNFIYKSLEAAEPYALPNDPFVPSQWHLDKVNVGEAWDILDIAKGQKIRVAVMDTFVNLDHEDLSANVNQSLCFDMQSGSPAPYPAGGQTHGTHVAGVLGAVSNNGMGGTGVGSGSTNQVLEMMALNVFQKDINGDLGAPTSVLMASIDVAMKSGARVINMSLGRSRSNVSGTDLMFEEAINKAVSSGVVVVAAAGNNGNSDTFYPSDFEQVISVINTADYSDASENVKSPKSNYGASKTLSAPGEGILSTLPTAYGKATGTSMSAPIVSGVAAMMLHVNPDLTPADIKSILSTTATDLYTEGFDEYTGWGNVNAYRAVAEAYGATLPGTPANLRTTAENYNSVSIRWDLDIDAAGYNIYRSETEIGGYSLIQTNIANTQNTYTDSGLITGRTYYYKVAAYVEIDGEQIESIPAGPVSGHPHLDIPANLAAEKIEGKDAISLTWDGVANAAGYEVYRSLQADEGYEVLHTVSSPHTCSYTDETVENGVTYYYRVAAYVHSGGKKVLSEQTESVEIYASDIPPAVENLLAKSLSYNSIQLSWDDAPMAKGYNIYRSRTEDGKYSRVATTEETKVAVNNMTTGFTYYFKVVAFNDIDGVETEGDVAKPVVSSPVNAAPKKLRAVSVTYNTLRIRWERSPGASGYDLYRARSKDGDYTKIATLKGATRTAYTDYMLTVGNKYYYKVLPFRNMPAGRVDGDVAGPAVGSPISPAPINLKVVPQKEGSVHLSWERPAGAHGYLIYRSEKKAGGYKSIKLIETMDTSISYTDISINPGEDYYYKVVPFTNKKDGRIRGKSSPAMHAKTEANQVEGIKAEPIAYNQIRVSWDETAGAVGYQLHRSQTSATEGFKGIKTTSETKWTDSDGIVADKTYYYKVRSYTEVDGKKVFSAFSPVASAKTENTKPVYSIGVPNMTNSSLTSSLFSMTNRGKHDLIILADSAMLIDSPDKSSDNDRKLTLSVDGKTITDEIVLKPGEQKRVNFTCSPAMSYTPKTYLRFNFTYDGRTAENLVSASTAPEWKYID